jgi:hypothetical protein
MNGASMFARVLVAAIAVGAAAPAARAQGLHSDSRIGFQFKPPRGYKAVPLSPNERTVVAKYQAEQLDSSGDAGGVTYFRAFELSFYPKGRLFDSGDGEEQIDSEGEASKSMAQQLQDFLDMKFSSYECTDQRELSISGTKGRELKYTANDRPLSVYCVVFEQEEGVFLFEGSALAQRFKDAVGDFSKAVKSFKRIEKEDRTTRDAELASMSEQERFLQDVIDKLPPGWKHFRSKRYQFIYDADEGFVKQLAERIEVMRDEYERLYPPDHPIDAISIVRVCKNEEEYAGYGGPSGSGGYWNWVDRELVFPDSRPREKPLLVCNHEAFHQYIYYFYGMLSPHSWYNEGTGDYFAGAKLTKSNRITSYYTAPATEYNRLPIIKEGARLLAEGKSGKDGAAAPLKEIMAFSQREYYGGKGYSGIMCYSQGWAIVHMLREAKGLDEKWKKILPDYLQNLLAARHQIATELMEKEIAKYDKAKAAYEAGGEDAPADPPKEPSREPKDYYVEASTSKQDDVQDLAFKKTFGDWTDGDWKDFQDFFLKYVEKL